MKTTGNTPNLGNHVQQLQNDYFFWLCHQIERRQEPNAARDLASLLHSIVFKAIVPNDDNREADGISLRELFCQQTEQPIGTSIQGPCTVLEMLVALACKIDFITSDDPENNRTPKWFWEMAENLGLKPFNERHNRQVIQIFLTRQYASNGKGGLFPLRNGSNQQAVEIWYQLMAYINENYPQ